MSLEGLNNDQFYCSGSLLRVELRDMHHPAVWGMPREPIVMFERGPAFDTKSGFRGVILAAYSKERNPLASGYLLHPERIQGKAAAVEVFEGDGRVYLFGFRPQWRGQSHGTYKLVFNAIYDSPGMAKPTAYQRPAEPPNAPLESWRSGHRQGSWRSRAAAGGQSGVLCGPRSGRRGGAQQAVRRRWINSRKTGLRKWTMPAPDWTMPPAEKPPSMSASCGGWPRTCAARSSKRRWMPMVLRSGIG
jgi:hypothetical protein